MENLPAQPGVLRIAAFLSVFMLLAVIEMIWPRRPLTVSKTGRWRTNLAIILLNNLLITFVFPAAPFGAAVMAQNSGWGLFHRMTLPGPLEIVISLLLLDLVIYLQHRAFHRVTLFWRLHRMHHTDLDLDVSSGIRFHPLEITLSLVIKLLAVVVLGIAPLSVLLFEILLNATSMFNHANIRIPPAVDRWLRMVLVTPDMHRVHHSVIPRETDSNFSFNLPWWDRLFGTYTAQPREGHDRMVIGLKEFRNQHELGFGRLLLIPFVSVTTRRTP